MVARLAFLKGEQACPREIECALPQLDSREQALGDGYEWLMFWQDDCLRLQSLQDKTLNEFTIDFFQGPMEYRTQHFAAGREMLCKAVAGKDKQSSLTVLDATAGMGRDGFLLALAGHNVTLFERSPVAHVLLADGLRRLRLHPDAASLMLSLELADLLKMSESRRWDVVYLDPMFPQRQKSALVKKEMRIFKALVGADADGDGLLPAALKYANKKVVVKRPKAAPFLNDAQPSHQYIGKNNRFDVYAVS